MINDLYAPSLALLTDLYQLTMGYGYWHGEMHRRRAAFHLFFRHPPFGGQYAISAGLGPAVDWLRRFHVDVQDIEFLRTLTGNDSKPLFPDEFLKAISGMRLTVDIDATLEGTIVFAHEPMLRVTGPLWQCQWIETALLNMINFQTLIATKAARVCDAAKGDRVLEFGLRRAQGIDGAMSASRAAFIGGCAATSNVLAGRLFGIPVKGTHAHSWVMSFDDELSAFEAYADAMPNNCVFLVDTYDTIEGVRNAVRVGQRLKTSGHKLVGIRLDSGDLAALSIAARRLLDEGGLPDAAIVASNELDEHSISELKNAGAMIAIWGVGTNLVTASDEPALGGVYKLGAIEGDDGNWQPRIKMSELPIKTSTPGIQQIRRYFREGRMIGDIIYSELIGPPRSRTYESFRGETFECESADQYVDQLRPILRSGQLVEPLPSLEEIRARASEQRNLLPTETRALQHGKSYFVGLEPRLAAQKEALIRSANA